MQIPENWKVQELGLECELITKGTTPTSYGFAYQETGINFIKAESIDHNGKFLPAMFDHISEEANDAQKRSILKENDLLFSIAGALGKVAIVDKTILPANTNQALAIIRLKKNSPLNVHYLFYFLNSQELQNHIAKINVQLAQANLSLGDVNKFKIVFPPLIEQTRIAIILSQIDQAIEQTEKIIAKYQRIKTGLMQDLLTRGIDEQGTIRSEETHEFKDSPFGRIPKEWAIESIGSNIEFITDYRGKTPPYSKDGIPAISAENIGEGCVKSVTKFVTPEVYKSFTTRGFPEQGDVIFTTEALVGEIAALPENQTYLLTRRVIALRPKKEILTKRFLYWYFIRLKDINVWDSLTYGSTVPRILKPDILGYPIPLLQINEQSKITVLLDSYDSSIRKEKLYKEKLQKIKTGLMQDLLTGKKRLNLD